jgi:hypothetical protein
VAKRSTETLAPPLPSATEVRARQVESRGYLAVRALLLTAGWRMLAHNAWVSPRWPHEGHRYTTPDALRACLRVWPQSP